MTLAVSRGFTPRATASVMMFVRSPRAVSLMTFQSLNVVSLAAAIWFRYLGLGLAHLTGLEPATDCLEGRCSVQ